jgi:hypothetical protein
MLNLRDFSIWLRLSFVSNFQGGCILYLESKLEVQISINRRIGIERNDNKMDVRLRLSFSRRTVGRFITKKRLRCQ